MSDDDRSALLARSWDEAADGYERYFVPRFAPWVTTAVDGLRGAPLPPGPILVPCCGTFPELPALAEDHQDRELIGLDLSPGMVERARQRAEGRTHVRLLCHDATDLTSLWPGTAAAVVSVFGLQQLPDPMAAVTDWLATLRPGGCLSAVFWPPGSEAEGPFALLGAVVEEALGEPRGPSDRDWPRRLAERAEAAGMVVERDGPVAHPMNHPDAETFWTAVTEGGSLRNLVLAQGEAFTTSVRAAFLERAPSGPWHHQPTASWLVARKPVR